MKTHTLFVLALFFALAANSQMSRTYIGFEGNFTYDLKNEFHRGTIKLPKINNKRNGGTSGTLRLEVWLLKDRYQGALQFKGHKIYTRQLGTLQGGWAYNNLKYDFEWEMKPPPGDYYVVFLLLEYNPSGGLDYALADYLTFHQKFTVTRPVDYDAFWDDL